MEEDRILFTKEKGIGIITLNRPDELNMLDDDMFLDLTNIQREERVNDTYMTKPRILFRLTHPIKDLK